MTSEGGECLGLTSHEYEEKRKYMPVMTYF